MLLRFLFLLLSLIIPVYNQFPVIKHEWIELTAFIKKTFSSFEIIIVDDGSTEKDEPFLKEIAGAGTVIVSNTRNTGKGGAIKAGVEKAIGDVIIFTDADIPFELSSFEEIYKTIKKDNFDMACGDRTLNESDYFGKISYKRKIMSRLINSVTEKFLTGRKFDTQCGIKGFKATVAKKLFSSLTVKGYLFDVELFLFAMANAYKICKVPVKLRQSDGASIGIFKDGPSIIRQLLQIRKNKIKGLYNAVAK